MRKNPDWNRLEARYGTEYFLRAYGLSHEEYADLIDESEFDLPHEQRLDNVWISQTPTGLELITDDDFLHGEQPQHPFFPPYMLN